MKIAIIGGSGFIGKCFLEEFKSKFELIKVLLRKPSNYKESNIITIIGSLKDYSAIKELIDGVDVVIHAGFDPLYEENIIGINNILKSISTSKTPRFIYLSSYIVYKMSSNLILSENTPSSDIGDIYTKEKQHIEKLIEKFALENPETTTVVLQPSIVYGLGGNWTTTFIKAVKQCLIQIPDKGRNICPLVYVKDVSNAIFLSINYKSIGKSNYEKFLISGNQKVNWANAYQIHADFLLNVLQTNHKIEFTNSYNGKFGNNFIKDILINVFYSKTFSSSFNLMLKLIKKRIYKKENLIDIINTKQSYHPYNSVGLYKFLHSINQNITLIKAENALGFKSRYDITEGINDMTQEYSRYQNN